MQKANATSMISRALLTFNLFLAIIVTYSSDLSWLEDVGDGGLNISYITAKRHKCSASYRIDASNPRVAVLLHQSGAVGTIQTGGEIYQVSYDSHERLEDVTLSNSIWTDVSGVFQQCENSRHISARDECEDAWNAVCSTGVVSMGKLIEFKDKPRGTTSSAMQSIYKAMVNSCSPYITRDYKYPRYSQDAGRTGSDSTSTRFNYKTIEGGKRKLTPTLMENAPLGSQEASRLAKIGYMIMANGLNEIRNTKRLLKEIYHPRNFYLVHLDRENDDSTRKEIEDFVSDWENVRCFKKVLEPAQPVTWGGATLMLVTIFGLTSLVQWSDKWDYFVNLSASDYPLVPQNKIMETLGLYRETGVNFMDGQPISPGSSLFFRSKVFAEDEALYREADFEIEAFNS